MEAKQQVLRQQRRQNRSKVRQALLINDYIFYKYFNIYQEAALFYNEVNEKYPKKPDLRRTDEFKAWIMAVTWQPIRVRTKRPFPSHSNIQIPECIDPGTSFTAVYNKGQTSSSETKHPDLPESPHAQPESPEHPDLPESPHAQPESPEHPDLPESPHAQPESPEHPDLPESPHAQPESPEHPDLPESPHAQPESPVQQIKREKVMELKIPLMKSPTVTTQTLQTVTEEILQESTAIYPSLQKEIDPEVIERIINELRQDPDLKDIVTAVEEQIEVEQIGMDVDISIDDRLENELEDLFW